MPTWSRNHTFGNELGIRSVPSVQRIPAGGVVCEKKYSKEVLLASTPHILVLCCKVPVDPPTSLGFFLPKVVQYDTSK